MRLRFGGLIFGRACFGAGRSLLSELYGMFTFWGTGLSLVRCGIGFGGPSTGSWLEAECVPFCIQLFIEEKWEIVEIDV